MSRAAVLFLCALSLAGCKRGPSPGEKKLKPERRSVHAGITLVEVRVNGAGEDAPIVVGIHGRGDTPESYGELYYQYPARVRFILPRAPRPWDEGYTWFDLHINMPEAELAVSVSSAVDALHASLQEITRGRRYVVTGFSQGGFLSYALAARHGADILCALPIAGALPRPLWPRPGDRIAPTFAFHGGADPTVAPGWGRTTLEAFQRAGAEADIREYPGVRHRISDELRRDFLARLDSCLARPQAKP